MCPACISAVAWLAVGALSTGGIAAPVVTRLRRTKTNKERAMEMPDVVSREAWVRARRELLLKEKEWNHQRDAMRDQRRKLPMVRVEKNYVFDGPQGRSTLADLFSGKRQLIVYHFMFDPDWDAGCTSCSFVADHFAGAPEHLAARDTSFAAISRAPLAKLERFRERMGWKFNWLSSFGSDFNYDFHVTVDEAHQEYNYRTYYPIANEMASRMKGPPPGEGQGLSVFLHDGENIYHTYSTFQRGLDPFINTYNFLDHTPLGRQEDRGLPMEWLRHHDQYGEGV